VARVILASVEWVVSIRTAVPAEAPILDDLHRRSSFVWAEDRPALEANPDVFGVSRAGISDERVRVAAGATGEILGFASTSKNADGDCELDDLFVDPAVMRRGIGRSLVEDAARRARLDGCRSLTVVAHRRNFPFYESVGFVVEEPVATRFGPAFSLRRALYGG